MSVIYEPKGAAKEYADLALNLYTTCPHGCTYCYAPRMMHVRPEVYFSPAVAKKDILSRLNDSAAKLSLRPDNPEVLLSFIGDPYPSRFATRDDDVTRPALDILAKYGFRVNILTKGGLRIIPDLGLISRNGWKLGTTLTIRDEKALRELEPHAASYHERRAMLEIAHSINVKTWVSLEPIIDPEETVRIIDDVHQDVDEFKIGKLNHSKSSVDWKLGTAMIIDKLKSVGAKYTVKDSLKGYVQ